LAATLALYLTVFGGLLIASTFLDRLAGRLRVPGVLLVLLLGLLTDNNLSALPGSPPPLLSLHRADELAQVAVAVVLFQQGLSTNWQALRAVVRPGLRLATVGSLVTALLLMAAVLGLQHLMPSLLPHGLAPALFIGAMVCSTDASAVMAVLRPLASQLPQRLIDLIECESAFNDPMAVVLAGLALAIGDGASADGAVLVSAVVRQFLLGALIGFMGGNLAARMVEPGSLKREQSSQAVLSLAMLFLLVGGTTLLGGSGLLAAYVAGLVIGNSPRVDGKRLDKAYSGYLKLAELLLFLCMGLVVDPASVLRLFPWILLLFVLMQVVRLVAVVPLLTRAFTWSEQLFVGLCGLRGAVPIALAIQGAAHAPMATHWGHSMPPLALGVVLLGLLLQGFALVPLAHRLKLVPVPMVPPSDPMGT
jgi:CPA1 family monovalent cation:H+ antiporter/cell volume regulation protein A